MTYRPPSPVQLYHSVLDIALRAGTASPMDALELLLEMLAFARLGPDDRRPAFEDELTREAWSRARDALTHQLSLPKTAGAADGFGGRSPGLLEETRRAVASVAPIITGQSGGEFMAGRILKSLPLMVASAIAYLAFLAAAVKGFHAENAILNVAYDAGIPIEHYILTVAAQVPVVDAIIKWLGIKTVMEFDGMVGTLGKQMIYVTNGSIIIGTFNSYFRQKSQIRRLMQGLASKKGDIPVLQAQASRAPEEIKADIIEMAIEHPEAHTRRRAMSVAMYANILTFPQTMIHNLHLETVEQNKRRGIAVSIEIIRNNLPMLEASFTQLLRRKIHIQLNDNRHHHSDHVLTMLMELRAVVPPIQRFSLAAE